MYYNIDEIQEYVKHFHLNENCGFTEEDVDDFIASIDYDKVPRFDWDSGATKLVIIPEDRDYVIKIPFNGQYIWNSDNDEDGEYREEEYVFRSFYGALGNYGEDYCYAETIIYEKAEIEHFERAFLPTIKVLEVKHYPIYVQPKAEMFGFDNDQQRTYSSKESKERVRKPDIKSSLPIPWLASCLESFDNNVDTLKQFLDFIRKEEVTQDLHQSNIGYYQGRAVIVDYGGYYE